MMEKRIETKRVWIFVAFAFGIAWTIDLAIYVTGGLSNPHLGSLVWLLLVVSMASPSLANILTRVVTGEGRRDFYLRHRFKRGWRFWATAWLGTPLLIGSLPLALVALWLLWRSSVLGEHQVSTQQPSSPTMPVHYAA